MLREYHCDKVAEVEQQLRPFALSAARSAVYRRVAA
jgi:hypothetical protein